MKFCLLRKILSDVQKIAIPSYFQRILPSWAINVNKWTLIWTFRTFSTKYAVPLQYKKASRPLSAPKHQRVAFLAQFTMSVQTEGKREGKREHGGQYSESPYSKHLFLALLLSLPFSLLPFLLYGSKKTFPTVVYFLFFPSVVFDPLLIVLWFSGHCAFILPLHIQVHGFSSGLKLRRHTDKNLL